MNPVRLAADTFTIKLEPRSADWYAIPIYGSTLGHLWVKLPNLAK